MTLIFGERPEGDNGILANNLPEFLKTALAASGVITEPQSVEISDPHPVYRLGVSDFEGTNTSLSLLKNATSTTRRYFVVAEGKIFAFEIGGEEPVVAINDGQFVQATLDGLIFAENELDLANVEYEVRFLIIPAVCVAALWLHAPHSDKLLPLQSQLTNLLNDVWYPELGFINEVRVEIARVFGLSET